MAIEFKKDPVLILRIDGEDLREYVESTQFEPDTISIFSKLDLAGTSWCKCLTLALGQLSVDQGVPPPSDRWVYGNIIEPSLRLLSAEFDESISQETFLEKFKKLLNNIVQRLQEHPIIVAHSENTYNGSAIQRLLSNRFELNKLLDAVWRDLPKDMTTTKDCLLFALDRLASPAELPPYGTNDEVDAIVREVIGMIKIEDGKMVFNEVEFKKTVSEVLESLSLRLGANPISVSSNLVIDEPLASSSSPTPVQSD